MQTIRGEEVIDKSCIGEGATHCACSCILDRIAKLETIAKAAKAFVDQVPCYAQGMSLISEEDVRGEYAQLIAALKEKP